MAGSGAPASGAPNQHPHTVQGFRDLLWLPIEQYRKDGRLMRGLQRGAASFGSSTASAALELSNRLVQAIQVRTLAGGTEKGDQTAMSPRQPHPLHLCSSCLPVVICFGLWPTLSSTQGLLLTLLWHARGTIWGAGD